MPTFPLIHMKQIKSKAPTGYVREANQAKFNAIDRAANVPGDTVDNSLARLRLMIEDINVAIAEIERDRATIEASRNS